MKWQEEKGTLSCLNVDEGGVELNGEGGGFPEIFKTVEGLK